jgi:1-aminocyclopropane-1-carboxylate deaminase/D-cysteine desulfhydrase-like pyridoxal-dependent ACC family enzyme
VDLATLPTPVHALPRIGRRVDADVWVKRDDATALRYGGNKVRKLEFTLGEARARGADTLITIGAVGSHHVFATALYGGELGFEVHGVLTPQPFHAELDQQVRADLAVGAQLHPARSLAEALRIAGVLAVKRRLRLRRPFLLPLGGSSVAGTLGFVNAGLELCQQVEAGECPDPHALYVACGSCATAAGLAVGLCAGGMQTKVVAVRVTDALIANRTHLSRLVEGAVERLRAIDKRFPDVAKAAMACIELRHEQFGRGYGVSTPESEAASHLAHSEALLGLDPTYTSKAFAALLRDAGGDRRGQRLLYWHTLSSAPLAPFVQGSAEPPEELVRLMRTR